MLPSLNRIRIEQLAFIQTGTYNPMFARPYQTNMSPDHIRQLQEATQGGTDLSPGAVAGVAGGVIRPIGQINPDQHLVRIENGWEVPRLRFFMKVVYEPAAAGGATVTQILTGYTDYVGVSPNQTVDPNMRLFFNNTMSVRTVLEAGPTGRRQRSNVSEVNHLIRNPYDTIAAAGDQGFQQRLGPVTMRPEDLFQRMEHSLLDGEVIDLRTQMSQGQGLRKSRRSNAVAPEYISSAMRALDSAIEQADYADPTLNVFKGARAPVKEGLISTDVVLNQFSRHSQLQTNGSMTYGELLSIDPTLRGRSRINLPDPVQIRTMHRTGQTAEWSRSDSETVAATVLANAVPSLLMDLMLTKITFMATNETIGGRYDVRPLELKSIVDGDLSHLAKIFIQRFEVEVLRDLTRNNNISVNIHMSVDVFGESRITISMNGQSPVDYVVPSFSDALIAPVVAPDRMNLDIVANDVEHLVSELRGHTQYVTQTHRQNIGYDYGNNGGHNGNNGGFDSAV